MSDVAIAKKDKGKKYELKVTGSLAERLTKAGLAEDQIAAAVQTALADLATRKVTGGISNDENARRLKARL